MKSRILLLLLLVAITNSYAQWNTNGTHIYNSNTGNVGIGDVNPFTKLAIKGDFNIGLEPSAGGPTYFYITTNSANNIIGVNARTRYGLWDIPDPSKPSSFIDFSTYNVNNPYYGGIAFFTRGLGTSGIGTEKMVLLNSGNVGIGTTTPRGKFDVDGAGDIYLSDDVNAGTAQSIFLPGHIYISPYNEGNISYLQARRADNSGTTSLRLRTYNAGSLTEAMHIEGNGNVGIGTTNPNQKLTVNGTIYGKEVKVDLNVPGPDYVFEPTYNLPSLTEIETYIKANKHLPEVPSAKEMEANGINLSEMNILLLKKVEELTLHLIEQKKENEVQGNSLRELQIEMRTLKSKMK
jgi:hypothetical protein